MAQKVATSGGGSFLCCCFGKIALFVALISCLSLSAIFRKGSKIHDHYEYSIPSVIAAIEFLKLLVTVVYIAVRWLGTSCWGYFFSRADSLPHSRRAQGRTAGRNPPKNASRSYCTDIFELFMWVPPALLYALSNSVSIHVMQYLDPATSALVYHMKIAFTAWLLRCGLKRDYSTWQWTSLFLLFFGVIIAEAAAMADDPPLNANDMRAVRNSHSSLLHHPGLLASRATPMGAFSGSHSQKNLGSVPLKMVLVHQFKVPAVAIGIVLSCSSAFVAALANTYCEWMYKRRVEQNLRFQNLQLYLCTTTVAVFIVFDSNWSSIRSVSGLHALLDGYTWMVGTVIFLGALTGIVTSIVFKHMDNFGLIFADTVSIFVMLAVAHIRYEMELNQMHAMGFVLCLLSLILYYCMDCSSAEDAAGNRKREEGTEDPEEPQAHPRRKHLIRRKGGKNGSGHRNRPPLKRASGFDAQNSVTWDDEVENYTREQRYRRTKSLLDDADASFEAASSRIDGCETAATDLEAGVDRVMSADSGDDYADDAHYKQGTDGGDPETSPLLRPRRVRGNKGNNGDDAMAADTECSSTNPGTLRRRSAGKRGAENNKRGRNNDRRAWGDGQCDAEAVDAAGNAVTGRRRGGQGQSSRVRGPAEVGGSRDWDEPPLYDDRDARWAEGLRPGATLTSSELERLLHVVVEDGKFAAHYSETETPTEIRRRNALRKFYRVHNKAKVVAVEEILMQFKGRLNHLMAALKKRYGEAPVLQADEPCVLDSKADNKATDTRAGMAAPVKTKVYGRQVLITPERLLFIRDTPPPGMHAHAGLLPLSKDTRATTDASGIARGQQVCASVMANYGLMAVEKLRFNEEQNEEEITIYCEDGHTASSSSAARTRRFTFHVPDAAVMIKVLQREVKNHATRSGGTVSYTGAEDPAQQGTPRWGLATASSWLKKKTTSVAKSLQNSNES